MDEFIVCPIPLRHDVIAQVHVPHDLTKAEAEKIARIIVAMAVIEKTVAPKLSDPN
jgi:hypothetical protein